MKLPNNICVRVYTETRYGTEYITAEAMIWDEAAGHPINPVGTPIWGLCLTGHIYEELIRTRLIGWDRATIDKAGRYDERGLKESLFAIGKVNRALEKAEAGIPFDSPWRNGVMLSAFATALKAKRIVIGSGSGSSYAQMQWESYGIQSGVAVAMGIVEKKIEDVTKAAA